MNSNGSSFVILIKLSFFIALDIENERTLSGQTSIQVKEALR